MDISLIAGIVFGLVMFIGSMNYFKMPISITVGLITFFSIYAYDLFNLSEDYFVTVLCIFSVLSALGIVIHSISSKR